MKRQVLLLFLPLIGSSLLAQDQIKPADPSAGLTLLSETVVAQTPYAITSRDGNQRTWSRVTWQSNAVTRELTTKTNSFIELATASAHLVNGAWVDSSDQIQITKAGAQATNSQHKVAFLGNINSPGAIDLTLPEGDKHLVSSIIGLSYMDGTGKSVLIAELKDSLGQLLPTGNQVLYPDAFTDFSADVLYVNNTSGFEQLIVLRQQPPSPAEWGLDPETTVLQVITEFFNPPSPLITTRKIGGATDEHLDFGITQMPRGIAFALWAETNTIPVTKQWLLLEKRQCLVESAPFTLLEPLLKDLPPPPVQAWLHDSPDSVLHRVASSHLLPTRKLARKNSPAMQLAHATTSRKGVALDYTTVTSQTNYTFQASTTYFVGSTNVTLSGTTTFEGGAVIKFTNLPNATISMSGASFVASTSPYRMVILTSKDDNSVGDTIPGSTGNPTNFNAPSYLSGGSGTYQSAQEQPLALGGTTASWSVNPLHSGTPAPAGTFRFTRFVCSPGGGTQFSDNSSSFGTLLLQDSEVWGGVIKFDGAANTSITVKNNLFYRGTSLSTTSFTNSLSVSNNLFWSVTSLTLKPPTSTQWLIFNNQFDSCSLSFQGAVTSGNNAYWNCNKQLTPTNASDITLTNAVSYQSGPLGDFYQLTNSPLINVGSCTADVAGLFHYTVTTNLVGGFEIKEANTLVDIGLHYVAVDSSGAPIDTDGDGVPDYLADANGNGVLDFGEIPFGITIDNPRNGSLVP